MKITKRDREAVVDKCQAVGTSAALLALVWAAIELAIGIDLLGLLIFALLTAVAVAAVVMIVALQAGWFRAYLDETPESDLVSTDSKRGD